MDEVITIADAAYRASKATVTVTAATPSSSVHQVLPNYSVALLSAFLAFAIAQFLKVITTRYKEKRWDAKKIIGSGGMPSSHSSTVVALAVSIGLHEGLESSTFAIAVILAFIVMYDASGVRLHAGRQAEVLNQIVCEFPPEHPLSTSRPLRDSLGHTPLQVSLPSTSYNYPVCFLLMLDFSAHTDIFLKSILMVILIVWILLTGCPGQSPTNPRQFWGLNWPHLNVSMHTHGKARTRLGRYEPLER
ncbi:hypothetical protein OSB04_006149 [Centaurea solstitialis]|uniref:Acid phosphatase/vanadium-dependent haloperoxidase-related protein n=1 Tax=Centaurea solstitialis TaxID=347529 RepID=A0AA38WRV1_9ASTR|nr:hypothetical protein OSB04_006149 [Centaurea solstitialis]